MKTNTKTPPIGGYYGGKASMVGQILPYFPKDIAVLFSPFCGFASVELATDAQKLTLCDANINTITLLCAIRDNPDRLIESLSTSQWGRKFYEKCKQGAAPLAIRAMGLSAMSHHRGGAVSGFSQQQCDRAARRDWSYLLNVSTRLQGAVIRRLDFRDSIKRAPAGSMLYLDPPYLDGGQHYIHTMSTEDHKEMLTIARGHNGPVAISGYDSELYSARLHDWRRVEFPARNAHRQSKTEVLWLNY